MSIGRCKNLNIQIGDVCPFRLEQYSERNPDDAKRMRRRAALTKLSFGMLPAPSEIACHSAGECAMFDDSQAETFNIYNTPEIAAALRRIADKVLY